MDLHKKIARTVRETPKTVKGLEAKLARLPLRDRPNAVSSFIYHRALFGRVNENTRGKDKLVAELARLVEKTANEVHVLTSDDIAWQHWANDIFRYNNMRDYENPEYALSALLDMIQLAGGAVSRIPHTGRDPGKCESCGREIGPDAKWCDSNCFNAAFNKKNYGSPLYGHHILGISKTTGPREMKGVRRPDPAIIQDAFHYALAAAGGYVKSDRFELESQFSVKTRGAYNPVHPRHRETRGKYLKMAWHEVKGSGLPLRHDTFGTHPVARPRGLKDAKRLAEDIYEAAFQLGIDANAGERFKP